MKLYTGSTARRQEEYFAVSVSESMLDKVREYIKNQEDHHKTKTFEQEYNLLIEKYGFKKNGERKFG